MNDKDETLEYVEDELKALSILLITTFEVIEKNYTNRNYADLMINKCRKIFGNEKAEIYAKVIDNARKRAQGEDNG